MRLSNFFAPECVALDARPADKDAALRLVAETAVRHPSLRDVGVAKILEGLRQREELGSTGFGDGIAIPHCRLPEAEEFALGLVTAPDGVDFESLDGAPARLLVFINAPEQESSMHLRLLSEVSQILRTEGAVDEIVAAKSPEVARESFLRHGREESALAKKPGECKLVQILIQDEEEFYEILNMLAGLEPIMLNVLEARGASEYLSKIPLFTGLWDASYASFCRLIVMLVDKRLINETVRRIERVVGHLDEARGVVVAIVETYYAGGTLEE